MAITKLPGSQWIGKGHINPYTGEVAKTRYAYNPSTGVRLNVRQVQTIQHGGISYEKYIKQHNIEPVYYTPRKPGGKPVKPVKQRSPLAALGGRVKNRMRRRSKGLPPLTPEQKKDRAKYVKRYNRAYDNWLKQYDAEHGTSYRDTLDVPDDVARAFYRDYGIVKHPDRYDGEEFGEAWDWVSDGEELDSYDQTEWGDTPSDE